MKTYQIAVLKGDGIGPEIVDQAIKVLDKAAEKFGFAIEYHRQIRGKTQVHSILDDIPTVGPTRRKALMRRYDSLEAIAGATVEELMEMPEINEASAREIVAFFAKGGNGKG